MFPKKKRVKNKKVIQECRKEYSELNGLPAHGEPHHVGSIGAGFPDMKENLIQLTQIEHTKAHNGQISKDTLFKIIAQREGKTVEEIKEIVWRNKA